MAQHVGVVAWFNNSKGFGFIRHEGAQDVFCHYSGIQGDGYKTLSEGDPVEFDLEEGGKGKAQATNVRQMK